MEVSFEHYKETMNWRQVLGWAKQPARGQIMKVITDLGLTILQKAVGKHSRTFWIAVELKDGKFGDPSSFREMLERELNELVSGSTVTIPDDFYTIPSARERERGELRSLFYTPEGDKKEMLYPIGKKKKILIAKVPVNRDNLNIDRNVIINRFEKAGITVFVESTPARLIVSVVPDELEYLYTNTEIWPVEWVNKVETIMKSFGVEYKFIEESGGDRTYEIVRPLS